jgi:hypothetical protein
LEYIHISNNISIEEKRTVDAIITANITDIKKSEIPKKALLVLLCANEGGKQGVTSLRQQIPT